MQFNAVLLAFALTFIGASAAPVAQLVNLPPTKLNTGTVGTGTVTEVVQEVTSGQLLSALSGGSASGSPLSSLSGGGASGSPLSGLPI